VYVYASVCVYVCACVYEFVSVLIANKYIAHEPRASQHMRFHNLRMCVCVCERVCVCENVRVCVPADQARWLCVYIYIYL